MDDDFGTPIPPIEDNENYSRRVWMIVIFILLLICCCCLVISGIIWGLATYGPTINVDWTYIWPNALWS